MPPVAAPVPGFPDRGTGRSADQTADNTTLGNLGSGRPGLPRQVLAFDLVLFDALRVRIIVGIDDRLSAAVGITAGQRDGWTLGQNPRNETNPGERSIDDISPNRRKLRIDSERP